MIKCVALENFSLKKFGELKNLTRYNPSKNMEGHLFEGDTFECDKEMVDYLTGGNKDGKVVIKVIEVKPLEAKALDEVVEKPFIEVKAPKVAKEVKKPKKTKLTNKK